MVFIAFEIKHFCGVNKSVENMLNDKVVLTKSCFGD